MLTKEETFRAAFEIKKSNLAEKEKRYEILRSAAFATYSRLYEIEREQASIGAKLALESLSGGKNIEDLKRRLEAISNEKKALLDKAGVKALEHDCLICNDSGYVSGKICDCVKRIAAKIMSDKMNSEMPLNDSRFDNFDLKYYSEKNLPDGTNPRRRMTAIFKVCREYAIKFDPKTSPNLLFMGQTGLGKTHLTLAIAGELINKGFLPVYGSAENLFSKIEKEKFNGENKGAYDTVINADLLIIDDLGTEMATAFSKSAFYNIINTRLLSSRPTIINTNLSMKEIETRYTARISSRFIGNYDAYKFLGDDIRQQKAMSRKG